MFNYFKKSKNKEKKREIDNIPTKIEEKVFEKEEKNITFDIPVIQPEIKIISKKITLDDFCDAIIKQEEGERAENNKNPGNLRFGNFPSAIGKDKEGYYIFPNYLCGYSSLKKQVELVALGKTSAYPNPCNLIQFCEVFMIPREKMTYRDYAEKIATLLNVSLSFPLSKLIDSVI